ncbi:MAG TPA: lyase family protein, partial [Pseudomonadales bacterium]|nr:lyase family protein [Pseudomonadales bacterium]
MSEHRIEQDSMGELRVPARALYGAQTQRAINNFPISGKPLPLALIKSLLKIKKAAALANSELGELDADIANAICGAVDLLLADKHLLQHFPIDVFQTGSGTSTNMNANEVLANLATKKLGKEVNANDHVNCGQSSNDTIPTAIHVSAALLLSQELIPALEHLQLTIEKKAVNLKEYVKTGRTHLMDALPVTMEQSL